MDSGLGFNLRPKVRKGKSLLSECLSRIYIDRPLSSDSAGFQVPFRGHFKEFSLFLGMILVFFTFLTFGLRLKPSCPPP